MQWTFIKTTASLALAQTNSEQLSSSFLLLTQLISVLSSLSISINRLPGFAWLQDSICSASVFCSRRSWKITLVFLLRFGYFYVSGEFVKLCFNLASLSYFKNSFERILTHTQALSSNEARLIRFIAIRFRKVTHCSYLKQIRIGQSIWIPTCLHASGLLSFIKLNQKFKAFF